MADGTILIDTKIDNSGMKNGIKTFKNSIQNMLGTITKIGSVIGIAFGVKKLYDFGKEAINLASDVEEVQNVVDTAFQNMAYKIEEFSKTSIEQFGISELTAKRTASTYMAMANGLGLATDEASDMAIGLTGLTADMSSFYNVSQEIADTALKSIFTGETETLKQFGIVMTQTNLQQFAYTQGLNKKIDKMTQAEQVQLRYNYVMQQTKLAQGDFAKTSDSWANQTRILSERWKEFLTIMGSGLIQALTPALKMLNNLMSGLMTFANGFNSFITAIFGGEKKSQDGAYKAQKQITDEIDSSAGAQNNLAKNTKKAGKEAKRSAAGFDELNILSSNKGSSGSDNNANADISGNGGTAMVKPIIDTTEPENEVGGFDKKIQNILSSFKGWYDNNFSDIFRNISANLEPKVNDFKKIISGIFVDIDKLSEPLKRWFYNDFTPFLQNIVTVSGNILTGLFDTFNMVFGDIWNLAVNPVLSKFINVALPMITQFRNEITTTAGTLFTEIKKIFDMIWIDAIAPVLESVSKKWCDVIDILKKAWDKWGKPIFDNIREVIKKTSEIIQNIWKNIIKPVWDNFMNVIDWLWDKHLKPFVDNFIDFIAEIVNGAMEIYNKFIAPLINWIVEILGPCIAGVVNGIVDKISSVIACVVDVVSGIIKSLKGVIQFIVGIFTGDWKKVWEGIKNIFKGIWDSLVGIVKFPINLIIDVINGFINGIVTGINTVIKLLNNIQFDIPDWVPLIGGEHIGLDINLLKAPKIPKLARGAIIPPNREFMAILGDQNSGTNIETPLATMIQAFKMALNETGGGNNKPLNIILELDRREFARAVYKANNSETQRIGINFAKGSI